MTDQLVIETWRLLAYCLISGYIGGVLSVLGMMAWQWLTDLDGDEQQPTKVKVEVTE